MDAADLAAGAGPARAGRRSPVSAGLVRGKYVVVGVSAGAAVASAIAVARELSEGIVVTVLPDDGSKYVSLGIFD